jgi:hypothetical protein
MTRSRYQKVGRTFLVGGGARAVVIHDAHAAVGQKGLQHFHCKLRALASVSAPHLT